MDVIGEFDPEILKRYEETVFQVRDDSGKLISFKTNEAQSHPAFKKRKFCILTASNPMNQTKSFEENKQNNVRLEEELRKTGCLYYDTCDYGKAEAEPSFTVENISLEEARKIGRKFGQYAVFYCDQNGPVFARC